MIAEIKNYNKRLESNSKNVGNEIKITKCWTYEGREKHSRYTDLIHEVTPN